MSAPDARKPVQEDVAMIASGSKVSIHYTLTVDGAVVDSSSGKEPLEYVQGEGMLVPGIEKGLAGAAAGEKRRVVVSPEEGYGEAHPELLIKAPRESLAHLPDLAVGAVVSGEGPDGPFRAIVRALADEDVTLDLNHPLAGKTLEFDVEVVSVAAPPSKIIRP
jgi:FKBP-type peptidyl-prolyl cis-trans isomerase SlyD